MFEMNILTTATQQTTDIYILIYTTTECNLYIV